MFWLIDCLIDWLIDQSIDRSIDWLNIIEKYLHHMAEALAYLLVVCRLPAVKGRVKGRVSCTDILSWPDFEFSELNNLVIDCVSEYLTQ